MVNALGSYPGINANMPIANTTTIIGQTAAGSYAIDNISSVTIRITTCPTYCIMRPGDPRLLAVGWVSFMDSYGGTTRRYVNFDTTNFRAPRNTNITGLAFYFRAGVVADIDFESTLNQTIAVIGNLTLLTN
jgi:hypothetical protein